MVLTFAILAITITFFIVGRLRADIVALLALLALFLAGVIDLDQALSGFSDPTVIMIAALFVVGDGLSRTGVTAWLGQQMLALAGRSKVRLLVVLMIGAALLSAFVSNTGTVATLMPAVISAAWLIGSLPSKFLMPLAFSANTGGLLTLTGTPPNIIVNETLARAGYSGFGYFEFALVGLPLLVMAVGFMIALGRRLLPAHEVGERPPDLGQSVDQLAEDYTLEGNLYWLRVRYGSPLVGRTLAEAALGRDYGISVLRISREPASAQRQIWPPSRVRPANWLSREVFQPDQEAVPGPETIVHARDVLLVTGSQDAVDRLMVRFNLGVQPAGNGNGQLAEVLLSHEVGVAEVLLTPRSAYVGRSVGQAHFAEKYNVMILSVRRGGRQIKPKDVRLRFGDALLVRGRWADIDLLRNEARNFVVVGSPEAMARQVVELSPQAVVAVVSLLGMIVLMVSGLVPTVIAALVAAMAMILGGCLNMNQAYRAISWRSVVLIAAMIPMSIAMQVSGGAEFVADGLVNSLGAAGPLALMAVVFILTTALSQVISNSATTILIAPVVLQAAVALGVSPYPILMTVAISASTAFLTPIGTSTNLMVSSPGAYSFKDFIRVGAPLVLLFMAVTLILVPIIWPF
ncbi:MAG: SLC13 family permease [Chloroflexota bacterium]|jgi:di/tricarboxylate transporter